MYRLGNSMLFDILLGGSKKQALFIKTMEDNLAISINI